MSKRNLSLPLALLLSSCMALPGSDTVPSLRYDLPMPDGNCRADGTPLALTVSEVNPGLDSDRIARRDAQTGEVVYLQDMRWVGRSTVVVEKALARDLECHGYAVLSGRHRRGDHDQLVCEVRALNLVQLPGRDAAEVHLSCLLFRTGKQDIPMLARGRSAVERWSAPTAITALGSAYRQAVDALLDQLPAPTSPVE